MIALWIKNTILISSSSQPPVASFSRAVFGRSTNLWRGIAAFSVWVVCTSLTYFSRLLILPLSLHALMRWSVTSHSSCILSTKFTCDCACVGALQQRCKAPGQKHAVHFLGASPAAYESWGLVMSQWSIVESQFSDPSPSHRLTSWNGVRKSPRAAAERGKWKCASWIQ